MPVKITAAGEYACKIGIREWILDPQFEVLNTYPKTVTNSHGEGVQHIHGRIQPLCQSITAEGLIESGDMLLQYVKDVIGRTAGFKPTKEWVGGEVFPGLLFICI